MPFNCDCDRVKISGYKHTSNGKERWLLFIANSKTEHIGKCNISGFDGFDKVINAYTGESIVLENGTASFELERFGHYILIAEMN